MAAPKTEAAPKKKAAKKTAPKGTANMKGRKKPATTSKKPVSKKAPAKKAAAKKTEAPKDNGKLRKFQVDVPANELDAFNLLKTLGGFNDSRAALHHLIKLGVNHNVDLSKARKTEILKKLG